MNSDEGEKVSPPVAISIILFWILLPLGPEF
jgi:hypothetical protein